MAPKRTEEMRLDALLVEYDNLRSEIRETFKLHLQVYAILLSAIGISLGYAFVNKAYDVFLVMPIISFAFFFRWLWDQNNIMAISYYLAVEIERKKLPLLIGHVKNGSKNDYENYWVGWQHFWNRNTLDNPIPRLHIYTVLLIFTLPVLLSLWRMFFYVQSIFPITLSFTSIDFFLTLQLTLNCIYVVLLIYAISTYIKLHSFYVGLYEKEFGIEFGSQP